MARSSNRKRKSVEKFHFGREKEVKEQEYFVFPGKGIELRKLPGLYERITSVKSNERDILIALYRVIYTRKKKKRSMAHYKFHLLEFSGLVFDRKEDREKFELICSKWTKTFLSDVMSFLSIKYSSKDVKDELLEIFINWLEIPGGRKKPSEGELKAQLEKLVKSESNLTTLTIKQLTEKLQDHFKCELPVKEKICALLVKSYRSIN